MWIADKWQDYELLDCGGGEKLERWDKQFLVRPDPQVIWNPPKRRPEWRQFDARYVRSNTGGGHWTDHHLPERWQIKYRDYLTFNVKPMNFKHTGLFPEQAANWDFAMEQIRSAGRPVSVLNLFAYTGAASLAAKAAGADVTHLDSVRQVVTWARGNMESSRLDGIRWVVEDALKFARREARRGNVYQGIILDPPAYGHGPDGEKWKLDECLYDMMKCVSAILAPKDSFMVLNLYSNGFSPLLGETVVREAFGLGGTDTGKSEQGAGAKPSAILESGELALSDRTGKALPLSIFVRLKR